MWTTEMIAALRHRIEIMGISLRRAAAEMGITPGSASGAADRYKIKRNAGPLIRVIPTGETLPPLPALDEPLSSTALRTDQLTHRVCKWPLNDGPDWLHCGAIVEHAPYCPTHAARAFNRGAPSREARERARSAAMKSGMMRGLG